MNNGVNETNNINNQNTTLEPVLQPLPVTEQPVLQPVQPAEVPVMASVVASVPQVMQPVAPVVPAAVNTPAMIQTPTAVAPVLVQEGDNIQPVESGEVVQNIPGVIVAPPQQGGTVKPNPVAPLVTEEGKEDVIEEVKEEIPVPVEPVKPKKKKNIIARLFFLIIVALAGLIYYMDYTHKATISRMEFECTPVSTTKDVKKLELDSTIVTDLYSKVKTTLREDLVEMELTDQMKIYLAFRQIPEAKFYDSNCNLFSSTAMEPYKCVETITSSPKAVKEEELKLELKKLFGDKTEIAYQNYQLGSKTCLGGYQYIAERGEYVEGECTNQTATTFKMDKKLIRAESKEAYIMLYEEVKYYNAEGIELPEKLKSGTYVYTFKLDMNYNYVYVSKVLQEK